VRAEKGFAVEEIGRLIDGSSSLILTSFAGLDSMRMDTFRGVVRDNSGRYFVVKNRTFGIAARQRGLGGLCELLAGQVGVVFSGEESLELLKAVVKFGKGNEELRILGGLFQGDVRSAGEMLAMAAMPPKGVAAAELVGALGCPLSELIHALSEAARSFVFVIGSIGDEKRSAVSE
jgi:large subunit ribosomal protein L10